MASSVSRLMVNPATIIRKTAPTSEMGIATTGMTTARNDPRNRKMTRMTISNVSVSVRSTSLMASWMYSVESYGTPTFMPTGSCASICGSAARTRAMTSSEFAVGNTHTPINVAVSPLNRVVGFALMELRGDTAWLEQLTVLDRWQGRGLGSALIDRTQEEARALGHRTIYLSTYRDRDGDWFDGGQAYRLRIAPNPPKQQFWALSVYDIDTRTLFRNEALKAEVSSNSQGLQTNADGSVDLYFGPAAPGGKESNWVQTVPDRFWFPYFRLYAPTQAYLDRSWPLADIEKVR